MAGSSTDKFDFNEDYGSEFEFETDIAQKRKLSNKFSDQPTRTKSFKPNKQAFHEECSREQGRIQTQAFLALDAYTRHKKLINEYVLCYSGATDKLKKNTSNNKTDRDIIRENHKFLWEDEDSATTWGEQLAKKYYDRLFKEYCLCDLTRYKEKKIGMRWRVEKEVLIGKGQFFCGSIHCDKNVNLSTWEVLFRYAEQGEKKSALVKLRLCEDCSLKLNYGYKGKAKLKKKLKIKNKSESKEHSDLESKTTEQSSINSESGSNESEIWKQPVKEEAEQTQEDAFEEFLEDLFL